MAKTSTEQGYNSVNPSQMKSEEIFNELFNTFLGEESIEECLKKAEWLTSTLEDLPTQLPNSSPNVIKNCPVGNKRKITVKSEPLDYKNYTFDLGTESLQQEKKRAALQGTDFRTQTDLLLKWKQDQNFEMSPVDCLGLSEEKAIKKARRKIKNKISAQESRRKKKEYVEGLERRVSIFSSVNEDLKERLSELESINKEMQEKILLLTNSGAAVHSRGSGVSVHTQTELMES
ncbi:hypothetical protein ACHWQZ_G012885 [Mnemiopsis leidyi]